MKRKLWLLAFVLALLRTRLDFFYGRVERDGTLKTQGVSFYFHTSKPSCHPTISRAWVLGMFSLWSGRRASFAPIAPEDCSKRETQSVFTQQLCVLSEHRFNHVRLSPHAYHLRWLPTCTVASSLTSQMVQVLTLCLHGAMELFFTAHIQVLFSTFIFYFIPFSLTLCSEGLGPWLLCVSGYALCLSQWLMCSENSALQCFQGAYQPSILNTH